MIIIAVNDPGVLKSEEEIPQESRENYQGYHLLVEELERRESEYQSYKSEPRY